MHLKLNDFSYDFVRDLPPVGFAGLSIKMTSLLDNKFLKMFTFIFSFLCSKHTPPIPAEFPWHYLLSSLCLLGHMRRFTKLISNTCVGFHFFNFTYNWQEIRVCLVIQTNALLMLAAAKILPETHTWRQFFLLPLNIFSLNRWTLYLDWETWEIVPGGSSTYGCGVCYTAICSIKKYLLVWRLPLLFLNFYVFLFSKLFYLLTPFTTNLFLI